MICWFCEAVEAQQEKSVKLQMYGEVQTSDIPINKKRIAYSAQAVEVPRCGDCKDKHAKARFYTVLSSLMIGIIVAAGACILTAIPDWIPAFIIGLSFGFLILFQTLRSIALHGIKKETAAKRHYPQVTELLSMGYRFGKRPSYEESIKTNETAVE